MAAEPVRVLIAKDVVGIPRVLRTDSAAVAHDVREIGTTDADELGIVKTKDVKVGVYLWEGVLGSVETSPGEWQPDYRGKLRPVCVEMESEIAGLFCMEPPADENEDREATPDNR